MSQVIKKRHLLRRCRLADKLCDMQGVKATMALKDFRGVNLFKSAFIRGRFVYDDALRLKFNLL